MEASRLGNVEIALLLLENGADPNLQNNVRLLLASYGVCSYDLLYSKNGLH